MRGVAPRRGWPEMAKPVFSFRDVYFGDARVRVASFEIPGGVTTPPEFAESILEVSGHLAGDFGIILDGRGPVWGYGMLVHAAHATGFVAVRDPRLGAVVVSSHVTGYKTGDVIDFPPD